MSEVAIRQLGAGDVEAMRPLWLSLHAHHQSVAPELGPFATDEASWRVRRAVYARCLGGEGFGFAASGGALGDVGYAIVATTVDDPLWADTWVVDRRVAELESLAVLPAMRGQGIGTKLLDAVDAELERRGIADLVIGALPQNRGAIRLYESRGLRPSWLVMTRFGARRP